MIDYDVNSGDGSIPRRNKLPIWLAVSELKLSLLYSYHFLMVACRPLGDSRVRRTNNAPKSRHLQIRIFCDATPGLALLMFTFT